MGQISPAIPLSWLHAPSSAFSHPHLLLQNPNQPPTSVYPVFSGSHSSHTHPLSGRDSKQKAFHKFLFSILYASPLTFLLDLFSVFPSCFFYPPLIPITSAAHVFLQRFHHSEEISITSHWQHSHSCIDRTDLGAVSPFVYVWVCSHAPLKFIRPLLTPVHLDHLAPCRVEYEPWLIIIPVALLFGKNKKWNRTGYTRPKLWSCFSFLCFTSIPKARGDMLATMKTVSQNTSNKYRHHPFTRDGRSHIHV